MKTRLIHSTGTVTVYFRVGQPVSFHGTVSRWNSLLRANELPMVSATPPLRIPYVDWDRVTAITVEVDPDVPAESGL